MKDEELFTELLDGISVPPMKDAEKWSAGMDMQALSYTGAFVIVPMNAEQTVCLPSKLRRRACEQPKEKCRLPVFNLRSMEPMNSPFGD